jgi:hypothetical protein
MQRTRGGKLGMDVQGERRVPQKTIRRPFFLYSVSLMGEEPA